LEHRLKSAESLARKVQKIAVERFVPPGEADAKVHDVVRYTVVSPVDGLLETVKVSIENLSRSRWTVRHAHHSYVDGNRYKGVHVALREPGGMTVEVQFHSEQSFEVKAGTTRFSSQERDAALPIAERAAARHHQIERADEIATPPGLEGLRELGGVAGKTKGYPGSGSTRPHPTRTSGTGQASGGSSGPFVAEEQRLGLAAAETLQHQSQVVRGGLDVDDQHTITIRQVVRCLRRHCVHDKSVTGPGGGQITGVGLATS
jgi:hypothetical protein